MDPEEYNKLLTDAYTKWGYGTQALIWIEEMAELIQKLAKQDRKINPSFRTQIIEELADVDICLDQMKILYPDFQEIKERKIQRLKRLVYPKEWRTEIGGLSNR